MRAAAVAMTLVLAAGPAAIGATPQGSAAAVSAPGAREAIARVSYAEAGGQGDSGLAAVVFTILNRLRSGAWGVTIDQVVNARAQFEPVMRAGGDWRNLRPVSAAQQARIDTILNLALEGRLPDLTAGARYFQNPAIVAARARAGTVAPDRVHFGGATPSAVIGDHAFYVAPGGGVRPAAGGPSPMAARGLFVLADGKVVEDAAAGTAAPVR